MWSCWSQDKYDSQALFKKTLFQIQFDQSSPLFPSTKTSSFWLVVMTMMGTGYRAGRNQSRSQYTVIKFPNPHAKFPFASSSFSTFPLLCSLSPSSAFISLYFPWYLIQQRHLGYSFYSLASPALYTFLSPCFFPYSLLSPPCPLHLLLDYSLGLILPWHTLGRQMKETLSDCLVFQRSMIPHKGTWYVCFLPALVWNTKNERIFRDGKNW